MSSCSFPVSASCIEGALSSRISFLTGLIEVGLVCGAEGNGSPLTLFTGFSSVKMGNRMSSAAALAVKFFFLSAEQFLSMPVQPEASYFG